MHRQKGLKGKITEDQISAELFDLLSDEDRQTINTLKSKALSLYMSGKRTC
jgi:hypothetical protein